MIALHTHGHKATITAYDGVDVNPLVQITRDVHNVAPAQRIDLDLYTKDDGLHSYGEGVWLMHDHAERAITTNGIAQGGNISQIVYRKYLNKNAMASVEHEDLSPYFSPEYSKGNLPTWMASDAFGFFDDVGERGIETYKDVLMVIVLGLLLAVLLLLSYAVYSCLLASVVKIKNKRSS